FDSCGACGLPIGTGAVSSGGFQSFLLSHGSLICGRCTSKDVNAIRISEGAVRFYRSLLKWHPSRINRMKVHERLLSGVNETVDSHIAQILGRSAAVRTGDFSQAGSLDRRQGVHL
ncbi:MAG: hypothetical protein HGA78_12720, partial [Nitrospirales bacterium]|nr:hypothetical protein [Nitrospirales bacterium]